MSVQPKSDMIVAMSMKAMFQFNNPKKQGQKLHSQRSCTYCKRCEQLYTNSASLSHEGSRLLVASVVLLNGIGNIKLTSGLARCYSKEMSYPPFWQCVWWQSWEGVWGNCRLNGSPYLGAVCSKVRWPSEARAVKLLERLGGGVSGRGRSVLAMGWSHMQQILPK